MQTQMHVQAMMSRFLEVLRNSQGDARTVKVAAISTSASASATTSANVSAGASSTTNVSTTIRTSTEQGQAQGLEIGGVLFESFFAYLDESIEVTERQQCTEQILEHGGVIVTDLFSSLLTHIFAQLPFSTTLVDFLNEPLHSEYLIFSSSYVQESLDSNYLLPLSSYLVPHARVDEQPDNNPIENAHRKLNHWIEICQQTLQSEKKNRKKRGRKPNNSKSKVSKSSVEADSPIVIAG